MNVSGGSATEGASATATGTITEPDEQSLPVASLSGGNSAIEGNDVEFTITLSKASESTVTVLYTPHRSIGDTATRRDDFTWIGGSASFFEGATGPLTLGVTTTDDAIDEESETFTVTLTSATNAVLGTRNAGGTILDNDSPPTVSVSDASATEGAAVSFSVSLSAESGKEVTVPYATSGGTATSGTDFTAASGTLTFAAGVDSQTVNVSTTEDTDAEGDETFSLTLSSATNATLNDATATGTINDDDATGPPTLNMSGGSADEGNAVNFTVSLSVESEKEVTVRYATSGGTATSGTDFTATSGALTFPAGTDSQTVRVSTADDSTDEENETFTLTLSSPTNATLGDDRASGTIRDNDDPPTVSVADANAGEGADVVFTVSLSPASGKRVTVEYATSSVSATSGTDYTAASGTLAFGAGTTSQTVSVSTANDSITEGNEFFVLNLSTPTNAILAANDSTATGTIVDVSEPAPDLVVSSPTPSDSNPVGGTAFTLSATVQNQGTGASAATTLRYYRSTDATITASDTEEATGAVGGLPASLSYVGSAELTAPTTPGTYYYGACVDAVTGESDTTNNCSSSVQITAQQGQQQQAAADLVVGSPSVSESRPAAGAAFTLSAEVRNGGDGESAATTLRYYRSADATITASDTEVGTDAVAGLAASAASIQSVELTAPSAGTHYYGACVDAVADESDTANNCSPAARVDVPGTPSQTRPDLVVGSPSVSESRSSAGAAFTLSAEVRNGGDGESAATTLRYYRSADATITASDTEVGTDAVAGLAASAASIQSVELTAPSAGTHYYGACVDAVADESDTANNCSPAARVDVPGTPSQTRPDLVVGSPSVSESRPSAGAAFTLSAEVRNGGDGESAATTLRYYRSADATITASDTEVGTDAVAGLAASAASIQSVELTAPSAGTHYYGACVDAVADESDTANNCSPAARVDVPGTPSQTRPDLVVGSPSVSESSPAAGAAFTLSAEVRNGGDGESAATTLRYYRSADATITASDTEVGTDAVAGLAASAASIQSVELTAPSAGTHYYGACVDAVADESDTANNCSPAARVDVVEPVPALPLLGQLFLALGLAAAGAWFSRSRASSLRTCSSKLP